MRIRKCFTCAIDLLDIKHVYMSDKKAVALELLNTKFVGRCYKSCLILSITNIIQISRTSVSTAPFTPHFGALNVSFEAEVEIYSNGDLILDAKVVQIDNNRLFMLSEYANIEVHFDKVLPIFTVGANFPVSVDKALYALNENKISVLGKVFMPTLENDTIIRIDGKNPILRTDIDKKLKMIANLDAKLEDARKHNQKSYDFFTGILISTKFANFDNKKYKKIDFGTSSSDLVAAVERETSKSGAFIMRPIQSRQEKSMYVAGESDSSKFVAPLEDAILFMLNDYYLYIYKLYDLMVYFDKNIGEYKLYWALYKSATN